MDDNLKKAYGDWGVILAWAGGSVACFSFLITVLTTPLSDVVSGFLAAYQGFFHAPFRILNAVFSIDAPDWLRDLVVFWLMFGGMGARAFLKINKGLLDKTEAMRERLSETLADPTRTEALVLKMGSREAVRRETEFLDEQLAKARETNRRRSLLVFGCLVTGPLFMVGLAWYDPPQIGGRGGGRRLLLIEVLATAGAVIVMFVLNWSLD